MNIDRRTLRAVSRAVVIAVVVGGGGIGASEQPAYADNAVLDGTYRLYFDGSQGTVNGSPAQLPRATYWYAFRSACVASGCVANGTQVNTDDRSGSGGFSHKVTLQFANGQWVRSGTYETKCSDGGTTSWTTQWSLTPQANETLTGTRVDTPGGNLCGGTPAGVIAEPITATREGDVGQGVDVAPPT